MRPWVWLSLLLLGCAAAPRPVPKGKSARDFYVEGKLQFQVEQYAEALADWENSYVLNPNPALLFDLGQANRHLGNYDRALENFRDYLVALPQSDNRATVEKLIVETKRAAATTRRKK